MALSSNLLRLRDTKFTKLEKAAVGLSVANAAFAAADGDGLTEEERNAILLEETIFTSIGVTISAAKFFAEKRLESAKEFRSAVKDFELTLAGVENAAKSGDIVTLIGGFLPGVGPVIRKLDLRGLLERIDAKADPIASDVDRALEKNQVVIDRLETSVKFLGRLDVSVTAIEVALDTYELAQNVGALTSQIFIELFEDAAPGFGALSTDRRVENAFDGLTARFEAKTDAITKAAAVFEEVSVPISDILNQDLKPAVVNFQNTINQLSAPLNSLGGLASSAGVFTTAVNAVASPVNAFLNLLEDGPGILPSIRRSDIEKVLNFLSDLSGLPLKAFNLIFGPILAPLEARAQALFDRAVNLDAFSGPADLIDQLLADALAAINQFQPILERVEAALADLTNLPEIGLKEFVAEAGDDRVTFFGDDDDDVLIGMTVAQSAEAASGPFAAATAEDPDALADIAGAVLNGGGGSDDLTGTEVEDLLIGATGKDTLKGLGGDDVLVGGEEDDILTGGLGDDVIDGGAGQDVAIFSGLRAAYTIAAANGVLSVVGPDGQDDLVGVETLRFDDGDVDVASFLASNPQNSDAPGGGSGEGSGEGSGGGAGGGSGADQPALVVGDDAPDRFLGGSGGDTLLGGAGADTLNGQDGDDRLVGGADDDVVTGGAGDDLMLGNGGDDRMKGGGGNDVIRGGGGDDDLRGGGGDDVLRGGGGADDIRGNGGSDTLKGNGGGDDIRGGGGGDDIQGNGGADTLRGNGGADEISGGGGDDVIIGGRGNDTMTGGGGRDQFVFGGADGANVILQFQQGVDQMAFLGAEAFDDFTVRQTGNGALISFRDTSVLIEGENQNVVTEDDFLF